VSCQFMEKTGGWKNSRGEKTAVYSACQMPRGHGTLADQHIFASPTFPVCCQFMVKTWGRLQHKFISKLKSRNNSGGGRGRAAESIHSPLPKFSAPLLHSPVAPVPVMRVAGQGRPGMKSIETKIRQCMKEGPPSRKQHQPAAKCASALPGFWFGIIRNKEEQRMSSSVPKVGDECAKESHCEALSLLAWERVSSIITHVPVGLGMPRGVPLTLPRPEAAHGGHRR